MPVNEVFIPHFTLPQFSLIGLAFKCTKVTGQDRERFSTK